MHVEEFTDIVEAINREKQIKGWTRQKKKALIAGDYEMLADLSKSHPSTSFDKLRMTCHGEPVEPSG